MSSQSSQHSNGIRIAVESIKHFYPPMFEGATNLLVAEDWIIEFEKIFTLIDYTKSQKVVYVAFMLSKEASH